MTEATKNAGEWLARWTSKPYAYLTTTGRRTGQSHRIEIWFGVSDGRMFLLSGGRDRSDWVRNLKENAQVAIELGDETRTGTARILHEGTTEDRQARELLVAKYATPANSLDDWKRRSLAVVVEFPAGADVIS
jgi:deazaflavin-dependent oxidoreductase (nitroreductase family)